MLNNFGLLNDRLARCAQPDAEGFRDLARLGFLTVAKLNTEHESAAADEAHALGPDGQIVGFTPVDPFVPNAQIIGDIAQAIHRELQRPECRVVVHCTHGMDRTGLVCGAYRIVIDRWSAAAAWEEFERFNRRPIPYYRVCLEYVEHLARTQP